MTRVTVFTRTLIAIGMAVSMAASAQAGESATTSVAGLPDRHLITAPRVVYWSDTGAVGVIEKAFCQYGILCDVVAFCLCEDFEYCAVSWVEHCLDADEDPDCMVDDDLCNWAECEPGQGQEQRGLTEYACQDEFCNQ